MNQKLTLDFNKKTMNPSKVIEKWLITLLLCYYIFIFFFKIGLLPGLHGDEAWSGIKALDFKEEGNYQINGMNTYTGILQALFIKWSFDILGTGVVQMRIIGALLNAIALCVIVRILEIYVSKKQVVIFLIIFGQYALWMISPKVAWEVNTFTLIFVALLLTCISHIHRKKNQCSWYCYFVYLLVSIVGSYNHIIFSSIGLALLITFILWSIYTSSDKEYKMFIVFSIALINQVAVLFIMRNYDLKFHYLILILIIIGIIILQALFIKYYNFEISFPIKFNKPSVFTLKVIIITCILIFAGIHGRAYFEVATNYKVVLQFFSYECSILFKIAFIVCGLIISISIILLIFKDFANSKFCFLSFLLPIYMFILCLYTSKNSFRYYLILTIIIALYVTWKFSTHNFNFTILLSTFIISHILLNIILIDVFLSKAPIRAVKFTIGNGYLETSAHFLPKEPLLQYFKNKKVSHINYLDIDNYFLEQPILFYRKMNPWIQNSKQKSIIIIYDYHKYDNGFSIIKY